MRARFWIVVGLVLAAGSLVVAAIRNQTPTTTVCPRVRVPAEEELSIWGKPRSSGVARRSCAEWIAATTRLEFDLRSGKATIEEAVAFALGALDGLDRGSAIARPDGVTDYALQSSTGEMQGKVAVSVRDSGRIRSLELQIPCVVPAELVELARASGSSIDLAFQFGGGSAPFCGAVSRIELDDSRATPDRAQVCIGGALRMDAHMELTWTSISARVIVDNATHVPSWRVETGTAEARERGVELDLGGVLQIRDVLDSLEKP
jgi:hypothetical protein